MSSQRYQDVVYLMSTSYESFFKRSRGTALAMAINFGNVGEYTGV